MTDTLSDKPRWSTVFALVKQGLVTNVQSEELRWRGSKFAINDAGRAALAKEGK